MGTALHSLPRVARRLLQVVVPLRSLRGCGRYGVDLGIQYPPATDLAGGRSPIVESDHWSGVAGKSGTQAHRRTTPHSLDLFMTADHKILNLDDESRNDHWNALILQDGYSQRLQRDLTKGKDEQETAFHTVPPVNNA